MLSKLPIVPSYLLSWTQDRQHITGLESEYDKFIVTWRINGNIIKEPWRQKK
jgi:hypothetical protein